MSKEETLNESEELEDSEDKNQEGDELVVGNHTFKTKAELIAYTKGLQSMVGRQANEIGDIRKIQADSDLTEKAVAAEQVEFDKQVNELMENGEYAKATRLIQERSDARASQKLESYVAENEFWDEFFEQNKHLRAKKSKVKDFTHKMLWNQVTKIPSVAEQMAYIKDEWSGYFGEGSTNKDLEDRHSTAAPGSKTRTSKTPKADNSSKDDNLRTGEIAKKLSYAG